MRPRFINILWICCLVIFSHNSFADEMSDLISNAKQLCVVITTEGLTEKLTLRGGAKAELANIIKRLGLDVRIDGAVDYFQEKYKSVPRKDLLATITETNKCNRQAFNMLKDLKLELVKYKNTDKNQASSIRKCANGDGIACKKLTQFANKASIYCINQSGKLTSFDKAEHDYNCDNNASEIMALVALAENILQDCGVMYESFTKKCISSRKNFNHFYSARVLNRLEIFMEPVLH